MLKQFGKAMISIGEIIAGKKVEEDSYNGIEKILINDRYLEHFTIREIREKRSEWTVEMEEKKDLIPIEIKEQKVVLNGYLDPVEIIDHTLQGKLVYLQFYKRRWKIKGEKKSYHNDYELHLPGMKCTPEFGGFLKELPRQERHEFFCAFPNIRHISEEDF